MILWIKLRNVQNQSGKRVQKKNKFQSQSDQELLFSILYVCFYCLKKAFIILHTGAMWRKQFLIGWHGNWIDPSQVTVVWSMEMMKSSLVTSRTQLRSSWKVLSCVHVLISKREEYEIHQWFQATHDSLSDWRQTQSSVFPESWGNW